MRGEVDEYAIIQNGLDGNLCFIPGGQPVSNPSELLLRDKMKHLLDAMSEIFDWVILDSPPALPVHDASMLADICDGVLFVVRAGSTDSEIAQRVSAEFRDKNLLGVVLNRVDSADTYNNYYYGYSNEGERNGGEEVSRHFAARCNDQLSITGAGIFAVCRFSEGSLDCNIQNAGTISSNPIIKNTTPPSR